MQMKTVHTIYFLGIGGIGMSALARYFVQKGYRVLGYDRTPSSLTKTLEAEGIVIRYDEDICGLETLDKKHTLVIRTPAVPEDELLYSYFRQRGFEIQKRAAVLGWVTRQKKALCVAGTHGKTTTSTMLAHILQGTAMGANAFCGGIANNYGTNLLLNSTSEYVVVEADEFDRSFHQLSPYISIITSMDPDHLDIYGTAEAYRNSFASYARLVEKAIVIKNGLSLDVQSLQSTVYTYTGVHEEKHEDDRVDFYADNVQVHDGAIVFDFHTPKMVMKDMQLGVPAWVNIENGVAAMAVAWLLGASEQTIREGLRSFAGVCRRFAVHVNTSQVAYIDDYAHHPMELKVIIDSVKRLYPERYIIGVFQPHLYSRTCDFADDFAAVLMKMDEVLLLPIYPAREEPIAGVTSEWLADKIVAKRRMSDDESDLCKKIMVATKEEVIAYLREKVNHIGKPCVVITLGAGDIDQLVDSIKTTII